MKNYEVTLSLTLTDKLHAEHWLRILKAMFEKYSYARVIIKMHEWEG